MSRNIVFCSDGTGNSASSTTKTNVWRVFDALDRTAPDQLAAFDDGVGTSWFRPLRLVGLALGVGVKRNVLDLYRFLCRNYQDGDQLFGFGFSRGAFTIRIVAALVSRYGLVPFDSQEQLERDTLAVYRHFRECAFRQPVVARLLRFLSRPLRSAALPPCMRTHHEVQAPDGSIRRLPITIRFLGIWDTVAAYGLPIDELTLAVDRWIWPMTFADKQLPERVETARQALALDDERRTFFPIRWEDPDPRPQPGESVTDRRLVQAWFAGVHANVGGGYPDDRLAHVSLDWIMTAAAHCGLRFNPLLWREYRSVASADGALYDSRSGLGVFYRYHPRSLSRSMPTGAGGAVPLLHESVVVRMADGADHYAPISVDTRVDVLARDETIVPFTRSSDGTPGTAVARSAINRLMDGNAQGGGNAPPIGHLACFARVQDLVWWGRLLYLVMLALVVGLASTPLWPEPHDGGRWSVVNRAVADVLAPVWGIAAMTVPAPAGSLIEAWRVQCLPVVVMLVLLVLCYLTARQVRIRIGDWAAAGWNRALREAALRVDRERKRRQVRRLGIATIVIGVVAGCLLLLDGILARMLPEVGDMLAYVSYVVAGLGAAVGLCWIVTADHEGRSGSDGMPYWALLELARAVRTSCELRQVYRWLTRRLLPGLSLLGLVVLVGMAVVIPLANQVWFQSRVALGLECRQPPGASDALPLSVQVRQPLGDPFEISNPCWWTGVLLDAGKRYRIELTLPEESDWFDRSTRSGLEGFTTSQGPHMLFMLGRRWPGQNWFKPIARIGSTGATEIPLDPVDMQVPPAPNPGLDRRVRDLIARRGLPESLSDPIPVDLMTDITRLYAEAGVRRRSLTSVIVAPRRGELYLYVNDTLIWPLVDTYRNNRGRAWVTIERLD